MEPTNSTWHWQESGGAWKGVGIYHVTLTIPTREPLLGTLVVPNGEAEKASVEATSLGRLVIWCFNQIPIQHPEIRNLQYCLMPDHFHGIIYVTQAMPVGILTVVRGFWQGCKKVAKNLNVSVKANTIRHNEQSNSTFTDKPFIRVMSRRGQLDTMMRYVQLNPVRLATKRLHPGYFHVMHNVRVAGHVFDAVGNVAILMNPHRATVHVHKELVMDAERHGNTQPLRDYKNNCIIQARQGVTMVSPFISPHEQEVEQVLIREQHPIIVLMDNGFRDYYKPSALLFDACAEGRVLLLAPTTYDENKKAISRQECVQLNHITDEIAAEKE